MSAKIQAKAQASVKTNVQPDDDPMSDTGSFDEQMSGNEAASGDDESCFATPGDANGFLTVLGRKEKTQGEDHT